MKGNELELWIAYLTTCNCITVQNNRCLNFIRLLRVVITPLVREEKTTRSNLRLIEVSLYFSSLLRRGLVVLWGGWGERKREGAGHDAKAFSFFRLLLFL